MQWIDSQIVTQKDLHPFSGLEVDMVLSAVGYFGEPDGSLPTVGMPFLCHIFVGVGAHQPAFVNVQTAIKLPLNTHLAMSPTVTCLLNRAGEEAGDVTQDSIADCRQQPTPITIGPGAGFFDLGGRNIPSGNIFEIRFQLVSTGPVQGKLTGFVDSYLGPVFPEVDFGVRVPVTPPVGPPPSQGKIVLVHMSPAPGNIHTMNIDGSARRLVGAFYQMAARPVWSPNGSQIAFSTVISTGTEFHHQIFIMNADGTNRRRLTSTPPLSNLDCLSPQWSTDGSQIVMQAGSGFAAPHTIDRFMQIYVINADGTNQLRLTSTSVFNESHYMYPVFTRPRGPLIETIAFLSQSEHSGTSWWRLLTLDYDKQNPSRPVKNEYLISSEYGQGRISLVASRKHDWVAYTQYNPPLLRHSQYHLPVPVGPPAPPNSPPWIVLENVRTGERRYLTYGNAPTFTPDGNWIAYDTGYQTWMISLDGAQLHHLPGGVFGDTHLNWL